MRWGDSSGLLWADPVRERGRADRGPRQLPTVPDTGWRLPEEFPDLEHHGAIALDTETHDPDLKAKGPGVRRDGYIAGVAIGTEAGFRAYYPIRHEQGPNLPEHVVFKWLRRELARPGQPKVGAHLLYDLDYLAANDVHVAGPHYDVQVAEPLLDENALTYNLERLGQQWLGEGKKTDAARQWLEAAFGAEGNWKSNLWRAPPAVVGPYAESDVDLPLRIFAKQRVQLEAEGLWDLFELESRLIPMLLAMRRRGVPVNFAAAEAMGEEMVSAETELVRRIADESTGGQVDIWNADSLARVFDYLSEPYPRTAKTNKPSFTKDWLRHHKNPVAKLVNDARALSKLRGTFVEGYVLGDAIDGRIHTSFHQLRSDEGGTVTGRFSSSNPNLQNIPTRDPTWGKKIRALFVPEDGQVWWKFDWSQIEYRLIAHYAATMKIPGAEAAVEAYRNSADTDYHQVIADLTGLPRWRAKNLNFGLAYGQGLALLCENLGVDEETGAAIIEEYHRKAPFLRKLSDAATARADRMGHVKTLLGRRRRFTLWEKRSGEVVDRHVPGARRYKTYRALNAVIQGSAADTMKKAMVMAWEAGCFDVLGAPHLTVHDELDGSLDPGIPAHVEALAEVKHIMETCVELLVPLRADGGTGPNWGAIA